MTRSTKHWRQAGVLAGAILSLALASAASAQATGEDAAGVATASGAGGRERNIDLPAGNSATIQLPADARDVIITDPSIAQVVMRSMREVSVMGLKQGTTDAIFFDTAGRRILALDVNVEPDVSALKALMDRLIPGSHIRVEAIHDSIVLSGDVANESDSDKAVQIARTQVDKPEKMKRDGGGPQVINFLSIAGKDQVMLKVRIVEVQRNIIKQLGFNLQTMVKIGGSSLSFAQSPTYAINGALLGGITGTYNYTNPNPNSNGLKSGDAAIQAFERVGLVRTLAEPNLTAVSGESAKFLAGGEFPVPTSESTIGQVSVEFKQFGVGLAFTPVVLTGGRISLKISTEVSQLSNTGAFSLSTGIGGPVLVIPSLTVRRAETTVELPSGAGMMIAGLLQDTTQQDIDSVPGLKSLPVLGALFRSRDYQAGQTELVVIVTPYLVTSARPEDLQTPADGLRWASDKDTILLGKLNKTFDHAPEATAGHSYEGPIGYVVE